MDFEKAFFEYYAKLHIDYACKLRPRYLKKSERPDFVSARGELGLEVTRAVIEEWARQEAAGNRRLEKSLPDFGVIRRIETDRTNDSPRACETQRSSDDGESDTSIHTRRIIERIEEKSGMLSAYQPCREQWLYVFSETMALGRPDVLLIREAYEQLDRNPGFRRVFIFVGGCLFVLENGREVGQVRANGRTLRRLRAEAALIASAKSREKK